MRLWFSGEALGLFFSRFSFPTNLPKIAPFLYLQSFDSYLGFKPSQGTASGSSVAYTRFVVQPAVYRLSALGDGPKANTYLLELRFPAVNIRQNMTLAEDVRVGQYDAFIVCSQRHNLMPIELISFALAVRFMQIKMGI